MKFKGTLIGEASGSIASLTFSHNRGGQYIRQRAIPVNPATAFQTAVRNSMGALTSRWNDTLTQAQRDAWSTWSLLVPFPDSLGEPRNIGGLGAYVGYNIPAIQAGLTILDNAPTIFNRGALTTPSIVSITAPTSLSLAFTDTDAWANEDGSAMVLFGSRPTNPSINFFKGPYRFMAAILGDSVTPPTSPAAITMPFTLTAGQKAFVRGRVIRADGRWSSDFRLADTVV